MGALTFLALLAVASVHVTSASNDHPAYYGVNVDCPDSDTDTPPLEPVTKENTPALPTLPKQFEVTVECNILDRKYTTVVKEYYDFEANHGAVHVTKDDKDLDVYTVYDFKYLQEFRVVGGKCETKALNEHTRADSDFEFYSTSTSGKGGHVRSIQEMLRWGPTFKQTYMGKYKARSVPVHRWQTCFKNASAGGDDKNRFDYSINFFFSEDQTYEGPFGSSASYPVRIEVDGKANGKRQFMHNYEFISFKPGPISDPGVFTTPKGVHCPDRKNVVPLPKLDSMFTVYGEVIQHEKQSVDQFEEHFDGQLLLHSLIITPGTDWESRSRQDNPSLYHNSMTIIDDYGTGFSYLIDNQLKNCTVSAITAGQKTAHSVPGSNRIKMKTSRQMLQLDDEFSYVGKRIWRGIPVNVWSSSVNSTDKDGKITPIPTEVYFSQAKWRYNVEDQSEKEVLVGQYMKIPDHELHYNMFGYHSGHFDLNVFDISLCYPKKSQRRKFMLKLEGDFDELVVKDKLSFLASALREAVAKTAVVHAIRVTDISFDETTTGTTDAWFTILDKPPNVKVLIENPESTLGDSSLEDAEKQLKNGASSMTLNVKVQTAGERLIKEVKVVGGSIKTSQEILDGVPTVQKITKTGYSGGSMAGLAFAMIIIGVILGLVIAFFYRRRQIRNPYVMTN